ncbi:MAG: hypothetical protein K9L57_01815 [Spirochaetaceae bacterium]|nr:hypothetical protein [Spirochaetaceae bacterium]
MNRIVRFTDIVVVCRANVCRSPMAMGLFSAYLDGSIRVQSAGLAATAGSLPSADAAHLLMGRGLDISGHRAQPLTRELIGNADLILVMDRRMRENVTAVEPSARAKVYRLGEWRDTDIPDPLKGSGMSCGDALELIESCISDWVVRLRR